MTEWGGCLGGPPTPDHRALNYDGSFHPGNLDFTLGRCESGGI